VQIDDVSINRYGLKPNDIVINRVNSPPQLGKSVIVPALQERTVFESNMMRFRLDERILLPKILGVALQLENVRRSLIRNAKHAINQSSINQQDVGSLQVFQPPIALQVTYTEQCERVEGLVRTLDVAAVKAQAMAAALSAEVFDA
jgi:type I restriction enzyme S subunit